MLPQQGRSFIKKAFTVFFTHNFSCCQWSLPPPFKAEFHERTNQLFAQGLILSPWGTRLCYWLELPEQERESLRRRLLWRQRSSGGANGARGSIADMSIVFHRGPLLMRSCVKWRDAKRSKRASSHIAAKSLNISYGSCACLNLLCMTSSMAGLQGPRRGHYHTTSTNTHTVLRSVISQTKQQYIFMTWIAEELQVTSCYDARSKKGSKHPLKRASKFFDAISLKAMMHTTRVCLSRLVHQCFNKVPKGGKILVGIWR